jgi:hypothetical protein
MAIVFEVADRTKDGFVLKPLWDLLTGSSKTADRRETWNTLLSNAVTELGKGQYEVESAILSPTERLLAASIEIKKMFGLKTEHVGAVYAIDEGRVVGRVGRGQRRQNGVWVRG